MRNKAKKRIKFIFPAIVILLIFLLFVLGFFYYGFWLVGGILFVIITFGEYIYVLFFEKCSLDIPTPDGSNEPWHPAICYTGDKGWNHYRFWMAFTPYPLRSEIYRDRFECPCVVTSNDGVNWTYPYDMHYIDDLTDKQIQEMDYFSDPELVVKDNVLFLYYRLSTGGSGLSNKSVEVFRKFTTDGKCWSEREKIQFEMDSENHDVISPAIIYKDDLYYMWFVSGIKWHRKVYRMISNDGIHWRNICECQLNNYSFDPWHIDCKYINNQYVLTIYDMTERLIVLLSNDGIFFDVLNTILVPSQRLFSFYRSSLYRASLCFDEDEYKLYFSAGDDRKCSIGLMAGNTLDNLKVKSGSFYRINDFLFCWKEKYLYPYIVVLKKVKGIICHN